MPQLSFRLSIHHDSTTAAAMAAATTAAAIAGGDSDEMVCRHNHDFLSPAGA